MNADESLQQMLAQKEALDRLVILYGQAEQLMTDKGVETLGEAGPDGDVLTTEIAAAEADLEAAGGAPA
jgi:hypothetical protein